MKSHFTNALCGIEEDISCDNSDLDRPDLKMDLEEAVESECDTGSTGEEDSLQTNFI
jgi:hypothetical protein